MGWAEQTLPFRSLSSYEPILRSADISLHSDSMMLLSTQPPLHFHILWLSHVFPLYFVPVIFLIQVIDLSFTFYLFFLKFICESACNAGDCLQCRRCGFDPWVRKIPGEGNSNSLQYSCLGNSIDRGVWWATSHGVARIGHNLVTKPPSVNISHGS